MSKDPNFLRKESGVTLREKHILHTVTEFSNPRKTIIVGLLQEILTTFTIRYVKANIH